MSIPIACVRACALFALVASFAAMGAGAARAQNSGNGVTGTVVANDGVPIAGAAVVLTAANRSYSARSDARGHFVISDVPAGTYALHASAPGYQAISQRTVTLSSTDSTISVALSPATTNSLIVIGEVRASAGETVSTASAPSVTLSAQNAAAQGVTAASAMVWPQLSVTPVIPLGGGSNATVTFAVRGPDPTETLVDIDGHQMNNGNTGDFDLSLLDPAALQEVQVLYGIAPSSLIGPNTIGGGINILTLQPTIAPHTLLRIFGGSYGTFGETFQTTGTEGRFGYALSVHGTSSDGSVNQTVVAAPPGGAPAGDDARPLDQNNEYPQNVGSGSYGSSTIAKLRYQLGGQNGYGYLQFDVRNQNVTKDESALLTNFTPAGFQEVATTRSISAIRSRRSTIRPTAATTKRSPERRSARIKPTTASTRKCRWARSWSTARRRPSQIQPLDLDLVAVGLRSRRGDDAVSVQPARSAGRRLDPTRPSFRQTGFSRSSTTSKPRASRRTTCRAKSLRRRSPSAVRSVRSASCRHSHRPESHRRHPAATDDPDRPDRAFGSAPL